VGGWGTPGKGLTFEVREASAFEERSDGSQPTVPARARYAAPALAADRNRRRVNLDPNAGTPDGTDEKLGKARGRTGPMSS